MKVQQPPVHNTPYQQLKNSKPGQIVRENKVLSGVAGTGASIVVAGGAFQSEAFRSLAKDAILPAAALGVATVSALAVHDAVVNDIHQRPLLATGKIAGGLVGTLGGAQVIGACYDIPGLDHALTTPLSRLFDNGQAIAGAGVAGGGVAAGKFAFKSFQKAASDPEHRARHLLVGAASATASAAAVLGGTELIGRNFNIPVLNQALTGTIQALSTGGAGAVAGGVLLSAGAAQLAVESVSNFRKNGNEFLTLAESMGAVTAGLGGVELAGHGLGIKATQGLLSDHAATVGATALGGLGVALARRSAASIKDSGLKPLNSLGLAAGATMVPTGASLALGSLGLHQAADFLGQSSNVVLGLGLGVATYALGREAVRQASKGNVLNAAGLSAGGVVTTAGGLSALGIGFRNEFLNHASNRIASYSWEHVMQPTVTALFDHPVVGGAALALGVGGYLAARYHHQQKA